MTHRLQQWPNVASNKTIHAIQTTQHLTDSGPPFDVHPDAINQSALIQLQQQINLPHALYFLKQVHGSQCIELSQPLNQHFQFQADACFSRNNDVICAVMTADCLPVLLTDNEASFVAAIHCGWRSLYSNILTKTLNMINNELPITAWLGPVICQQHYQVDADFVTNYLSAHPQTEMAFTSISAGKSYADLKKLAIIQLHQAGVTHISVDNSCTYADDDYYSWRKNRTQNRQASFIWKSA